MINYSIINHDDCAQQTFMQNQTENGKVINKKK